MSEKRLLIFGHGVLAGAVAENLSILGAKYKVHIAGRDTESLVRTVNLIRYAAANFGKFPSIEAHECDLYNIAQTADFIQTVRPHIIFNATSFLPWWMLNNLPANLASRVNEAGGGAWTPTDAVLPYKLAQAVALSASKAILINGSYADVVNPALKAIDLGPSGGIGNVANAVPGLRYAIADLLRADPQHIQVRFVAHHFISYSMPSVGHTSGAPYHLSATRNGDDVTGNFDPDDAFKLVATKFKRVKGLAGQAVTASSATQVLGALLSETDIAAHGPGIDGLPGGYPIINDHGLHLDLPPGLTADQAEAINREGQKWDGIEDIAPNGDVKYTQKCQDIMKEVFGFKCSVMPIRECEEWAAELLVKYNEVAARAA